MRQAIEAFISGDRVSLTRIARLGLGGAIGGLITFIVLNPFVRGKALFGDGDAVQDWVGMGTILGAVIGLTIGACLIAAEEWHIRSASRIARRSLMGALAGAACGALGGIDGQFAFAMLQSMSTVLARCAGWALMGAGAGICPGLVSRSWKRAELGAFGGLFGGAAGGTLFDVLAIATGGAGPSRALGFVLVGAAIGIAVGFLGEMVKEYWLTVLTGSKEGQSFVLSKAETTIGRDETVDIPLFGDASVQRTHARVAKSDVGAHIRATPGLTLTVNSQPRADAPLHDGDIIGIGKHRLRFGSRRPTRAAGFTPAPPQAVPETASPVPRQAAPRASSSLHVISGPHAGAVFSLSSASISIGRSPECAVALPNDTQVSRHHATLTYDGACWHIQDNGSTNGLYVNGQRVSTQPLRPGDQVTVGQSVLRMAQS